MSSSGAPAFDPSLNATLEAFPKFQPLSLSTISELREAINSASTPEATIIDPNITYEDVTIPGPAGDLILAIVRRKDSAATPRPCVYYMHGGGMVLGNRFGLGPVFPWITELDIVLVSVEYRKSPDHVNMEPVEDCYAGLKWTAENASKIGIDPEKIIISGHSGGGGRAAGTALLARDRGGPKFCAQLFVYPMIDDRLANSSSKQFFEKGLWTGQDSTTAWDWITGGNRGGEDVSPYVVPARATNLSGLPPTYIDVGACDLFRDECVAYASRLWECGVNAELHVWPGAWHGFDLLAPDSAIGKDAVEAKLKWLRRILETPSPSPAPIDISQILP